MEFVGLSLAYASMAATVAVLYHYSHTPGPEFTHWKVKLGSIAPIFMVILRAGIGIPLASGIGQHMWTRLRQALRPLYKMDLYESASQGISGNIKLLLRGRAG